MSKRPRSNAARRASFGRAERLRREAGDTRQPKPGASLKGREADRPDRATQQEGRAKPARVASHERKPTPLHRVEDRLERSRTASERRRLDRLQKQTRTAFNREGERRRDTERRAEHDRKRDALQAKVRRIEDTRKRIAQRQQARKRDEVSRAFARAAADRKRAMAAERQKDLQRRAAAAVEKEQTRRAEDQRDAHRRQTDQVRARHKVERNSYRINETTAMERHHHAIRGIDRREADRLHDFDGRRQGLAGRLAELVPGRRAENDRERAEIVRGYEAERMSRHRDFEAFKERSFEREMKTLRDQALERKVLMELHRGERATFSRDQAADRPRLVEERGRALDRADRAQEQERQREQEREAARGDVRPSGDFARAASDHAPEPVGQGRELVGTDAGARVRPVGEFGRG